MSEKNSVTRADVCERITDAVPSVSHKDAVTLVNGIIEEIRGAVSKGEEVKISRFGKFALQEKKPRRGRNPKTGEELTISERRVLKFKTSDWLRSKINENIPGAGSTSGGSEA